jgi:hypothetical protein
MKLPFSKPTLVVLVASAAIAIFAWLQSDDSNNADDLQPVTHAERTSPGSSHKAPIQGRSDPVANEDLVTRLAALTQRTVGADDVSGIFGANALSPPPPPPRPRPKPTAPPFPYAFMGALRDGSEPTLFLSNGERVLVVKADQTVDGAYHIDKISDSQLIVTYLPLHQQQTIVFGTTQ